MFLHIYKHPHERQTIVNCNLFIEFLQDMHNLLEVTVISKQILWLNVGLLHSISKYCKKHLLGV